MKFNNRFLLLFCIVLSTGVFAQKEETEYAITNYYRYHADGQKVKDAVKEKSIVEYRHNFSLNGYRQHELSKCKMNGKDCIDQLSADGQFADLIELETKIYNEKLLFEKFNGTDNIVANFLVEAHNRIWKIAVDIRKGKFAESDPKFSVFLKAILHYGAIEIGRSNTIPRFHASCFAIPTAAVNTYFCMLKKMDEVESGKIKNEQLVAVCDILKTLALQAWTQPLRKDDTDKNVVQIDRFRNHVWWVGGNALAYRSLLPVAFMYKSIPMIDLIADVSQKCISTTSQNTISTAFWTEGFTADGAGWGHGKQSLVWGYPIDGTSNALSMLNDLKGSPWTKKLSRENVNALFNFFQGANWYYFKGFSLPGLDRHNFFFENDNKAIRYVGMLNTIISDWKDSFTAKELTELKQLLREGNNKDINMNLSNDGVYTGTRWFFNNDDLIKKNDKYHIIVNMASVRCDGLESALNVADEYNFFTDDGMTLFQRDGQEYRAIFGAWDVTAAPGVTAREGMEKIKAVTNWRGYCSKFNFAGAATKGENAVAGFIFEKMNASEKEGVNDKSGTVQSNPTLYGISAHKGYFMIGDYFIALGAGITNKQAEMTGTIRTSIDQTAKTADIVILSNGKEIPVTEGVQPFLKNGKPVWVVQKNKFSYTILPEFTKNASFACETHKTNWVKMNKENKKIADLPASVDMLRLWIDHGQKPKDETYGYVVYAGNNTAKDELPFIILQNDTLIQAIRSRDSKITEVVFYQSESKLKAKEISITASVPCVVLIEINGNEKSITVNDPRMDKSLKQIMLNLNGKAIIVDMPQGEFCGKPVTIKI